METNVTTPTIEVKKVTSEKQIADAKKAAIEKSKNAIKKEKSIFSLKDADFLNLQSVTSKLKVSEKVSEKKLMYKFEKSDLSQKEEKRLRSKIRNKRNKFANNIILFFQKKQEKELLSEVKEFRKFYLENYILNDYSLLSIASNNRDEDTTQILEAMLKIIALIK